MKEASKNLRSVGSLAVVTSMIFAAVFALGPVVVQAPPLQATLDVTFHDLTPNEHTFPGDVNVTMIWLEMTASGGNVQVNSIDFTLDGTFNTNEIASFVLWDDSGGLEGSDKKQGFFECELTRITDPARGSFSLPQVGNLNNCAIPFGSYIVNQFQTRFILAFLTVSSGATEGHTINLSVDAINTDGTVNGGTGITKNIEIMHIFFSDDMESGQGSWTREGWDKGHMHEPDGLWHLSSGEGDCQNNYIGIPLFGSPTTSWWYGHRYEDPFDPGTYYCSYDTWMPGDYHDKTRNMGNLTTPEIDATTGSSLAVTFRHMLAGESDTPLVKPDNGHLWLWDGMWHKVTPSEYPNGIDTTDASWWKETLNLSAYAGKKVQLELRFDTLDYMNNFWLGWFVDDLVVYGKTVPHDIAVTENGVDPAVSTLDFPIPISARYSNIGSNDETNIGIRLTIDNSTEDTGTIASLLSGASIPRSLTWSTAVAGQYWVCMEADPVPSESVLWNNKDCKVVNVVTTAVHYIYVVRSQGTTTQAARDTWNHLNANWATYGADQVVIDYASLDIPGITYTDISAQSPRADTLVISSSGGWVNGVAPPGGQLTDTETAAITKYTLEAHGLILTGTVFNELIPNNNDLTGLVGIKDQSYVRTDPVFSMDHEPSADCNPLLQGVGDPFSLVWNGTMTPTDNNWGTGDLSTGTYCGRSPGNEAAIVANKGVFMMSIAAERTPNSDVLQLLYNAMVNAQYQVFDHDVLAESIVAPNYVRVGYPVNVSANIKNIGKNDESVDAKLLVNTVQQDVQNVFLTATGGETRVTLTYTPATENDDNVCVRADILGPIDEDLSNNEVCTVVKARNNPPVQVFILDSWGTDNGVLAPWSNLNANWDLYGSTPVFIDWTTFNKENIRYQELVDMYVDVVFISNSFSGTPGENPVTDGHMFTASELTAIKNYVNDGHGLIVTGGTFDTHYLPTHATELGPLMGINGGFSYMVTFGVTEMEIQNPGSNHPLFYNIPTNYNTRNGTSLTPGFALSGPEPWEALHLAGGSYEALEDTTVNPFGPYGAVIPHEPGTYNSVYISNFVERLANTNDKQLLYNAMIWARSSVKAPSDLWVELWNGDNDLKLTWTENPSTGLVGYNIYKANTVDTFTFGVPYAVVGAGTTEYIDVGTGIPDPNNYYY
ncbi:MAG: hypothetical protein KAW09_11480, partial [Thermoplasmata archaeon]|nr:hypothetical protein [Thermoplasmata archaeon]